MLYVMHYFQGITTSTPCSNLVKARSFTIADRPHDMLHQLKPCQLLHSCTKITFERLAKGNGLEGDSISSELRPFDRPYTTSY